MEIPVDYALHNSYMSAGGANLSQSSGDQSCHGEPTDEEALYEAKYRHLMECYEHIYGMNNKLRHRIYHVKKEINHLKQLKRLLCERLLLRRVEIIDTNLEIPDNDSTTVNSNNNGLVDKIADETPQVQQQLQQQGGTSANRKRKRAGNSEDPGKQKGNNSNTKNQARDEAKRNIISIIESIVADTHKDRAKQQKRQQQQQTQQQNEATTSQIPSTATIAATMADASAPSSSSTNCGISSNSNYEPLSESDLSSEELAERLIHRRSSIDHLLPEQPDYEQQQDTKNKLWTASSTTTSIVEQKVEDDEHQQRMDGITEEAQSTTSIATDQPIDPILSMGANQ